MTSRESRVSLRPRKRDENRESSFLSISHAKLRTTNHEPVTVNKTKAEIVNREYQTVQHSRLVTELSGNRQSRMWRAGRSIGLDLLTAVRIGL